LSNPEQGQPAPNTDREATQAAVAPHLGAAALDGNAAPSHETPAADSSLGHIRELYRSEQMRPRFAINREIQSSPEYARIQQWAATWRASQPPNDVAADAAAARMPNVWYQYSRTQGNATLTNQAGFEATLVNYRGDIAQTRTMGFRVRSDSTALYNSPAELEVCLRDASEQRDGRLTPAVVRRLANSNSSDVKGAVEIYQQKLAIADQLEREGKLTVQVGASREHHISPSSVVAMAIALDEHTFTERLNNYQRTHDAIQREHRGNPMVTHERIDTAIAGHADAVASVRQKTQQAAALAGRYARSEGLSQGDIYQIVFSNTDPEKRIEGYKRDVETLVRQHGSALPRETYRRISLTQSDPAAATVVLIGKVADLKAAIGQDDVVPESEVIRHAQDHRDLQVATAKLRDLAQNIRTAQTDYDNDTGLKAVISKQEYTTIYIERHGENAHDAAREYANRIIQTRSELRGTPHMTDEIIRAACRFEGDPVTTATYLAGQARQLRTTYAQENVPSAVIQRSVTRSDNPEEYIEAFIRERNEARQLYGNRVTESAINRACTNNADGAHDIGERLRVVDSVYEQYGRLPGLNDSTVANRAVISSDTRQVVINLYAKELLKTLQEDNLQHSTRNTGMIGGDHYEAVGNVRATAERILAEKLGAGNVLEQAIQQAGLIYYRHVRSDINTGLLNDQEMLEAVIEAYGDYIVRLKDSRIPYAAVVAAYSKEDEIFGPGRNADFTYDFRQAARRNPHDPLTQYWYNKIEAEAIRQGLEIDNDIIRAFSRERAHGESDDHERTRELTQRAWRAQELRNRANDDGSDPERRPRHMRDQRREAYDMEERARTRDDARRQAEIDERRATFDEYDEELIDYIEGGEQDDATGQRLRDHFRTDDLRGYYNNLQNYLNPQQQSEVTAPDSNLPDTPIRGEGDHLIIPDNYERSVRGLALKLTYIAEELTPTVSVHDDRRVVMNALHGFTNTIETYANTNSATATTYLNRAFDDVEQTVSLLVTAVTGLNTYLSIVAADSARPIPPQLDSSLQKGPDPNTGIDPNAPDGDYKKTIGDLVKKYADTANNLQDIAASINETLSLSLNDAAISASTHYSGSRQSAADVSTHLSLALDLIRQFEADVAAAKAREEQADTQQATGQQNDTTD
jgi:hypothetical protein